MPVSVEKLWHRTEVVPEAGTPELLFSCLSGNTQRCGWRADECPVCNSRLLVSSPGSSGAICSLIASTSRKTVRSALTTAVVALQPARIAEFHQGIATTLHRRQTLRPAGERLVRV